MNDSDIGVIHSNYIYKGKTQYWKGTDSKALFDQNCSNPEKKEMLQRLGWLDTDTISYVYNSFGFRDEEFDGRVNGIALGCSQTEGIGLPEFYTWPRVLSRLTDTYIWNLGVGASSIDTAFRLLYHWLPKLKPNFVVLCAPMMTRVEVFDSTEPISILPQALTHIKHLQDYYKVWAANEYNAIVLKRKNLLAMQQLCHQADIPFRYLDHMLFRGPGQARDLQHHGVNENHEFAQQMYNLL